MTQAPATRTTRSLAWTLIFIALFACRLPACSRPVGGDQGLYSYEGARVSAGAVPYRDVWDQKPPGLFAVYAVLTRLLPSRALVPVADVLLTALSAWCLFRLGRRAFGGRAGEWSAAIFLLLGDPGIQRLGGMNSRAQGESFIALAVTAAVLLVWREDARRRHLIGAGALLALTFWLKYNAAAFALPIGAAAILARSPIDRRASVRSIAWIAGTGLVLSALVLIYFAAHGALTDLWLATISYNVQYSSETYGSAFDVVRYALTLPVLHAYVDGLWFVGLLGVLLVVRAGWSDRRTLVLLLWIGAAILSIVINGSRALPQYFLQAGPVLALAGAAGLTTAWRQRRTARVPAIAAAILLAIGLWRIGVETVPWYEPRLMGLPQTLANVRDDVRYETGNMSRAAYLAKFEKADGGKFSPLAVEHLVDRVKALPGSARSIFVFGFAGGAINSQSGWPSSSRFFWSRPVVLEFAADHPGYGSAGLLKDLTADRPSFVVLQKHDWHLAETTPDSITFFMNHPGLRTWLETNYVLDYEDAAFAVWRSKS